MLTLPGNKANDETNQRNIYMVFVYLKEVLIVLFLGKEKRRQDLKQFGEKSRGA